jgi:hypothetical protein
MSSADNVFYQSAKGGLAMRLNNAEQMAQGREGLLTGLEAQNLTLDDDLEHAKTNRDTAIFGISLGGGGAYRLAYGIGKSVGQKYLGRATTRLQTAIDSYRKEAARNTGDVPEEAAQAPEEDFTGARYDPIRPREDYEGFGRQAGTDIETPGITVTDEPTGGKVTDAYGEEFDPKTLDMSDPQNPKPFPEDQTPQDFPQSETVARDGFGNEFDPRYVDTSSYKNPQAVPEDRLYGDNIEQAGFEDEPIPRVPPVSQDPAQVIGDATTTEVRPQGSFKVLGQEPDPVLPPDQALSAGRNVQAAGRPNVDFLTDAQNARLQEIKNSDPILSEDNVGDLKKMGLDFGDLAPEEVDTGARMLLGDTAVEGLSTALGVAGGVLGAALPVVGVIGDLAGLAFAIKGLGDSQAAVQKENQQQAQLKQAIASTNIPTQVSKQGSAPVLDTSSMRTGGFQNF